MTEVLTKRGREPGMCGGKTTWGHSKKAAICTLRRQPSEETRPADDTLISDFQSPELRNTFLLFKPASLWYVATAALMDQYVILLVNGHEAGNPTASFLSTIFTSQLKLIGLGWRSETENKFGQLTISASKLPCSLALWDTSVSLK